MRQVFVGDQHSLVDQLIASCQKGSSGSNYQGFGRELVPFDFELHDVTAKPAANLMGALEDTTKRGRRSSPRATKDYKVAPKKVQAIFSPVKPQQHSPRRQGKRALSPTAHQTYCAPGFRESPKPEAVPLPTMALMHKALAKAVVRSCRSASREQAATALVPAHVAVA